MDYLPTDSKTLAMLVFFSAIIIGQLWRWIRNEIIKKGKMVDDHEVKIAVHNEKHEHHEKRLDHLEDDRTQSKR